MPYLAHESDVLGDPATIQLDLLGQDRSTVLRSRHDTGFEMSIVQVADVADGRR
jgi:hypothetical protein